MLERFFTNLVRPKDYPLMEGSYRPLGNKLAGMLKHSGNKLADMLRNIKDFFTNLVRSKGYTLMANGHKPLGNKLADMLGDIKNFFMSHFKSKKTAPEKKNNEPILVEVNGRKYIMYSGNKMIAVDEILVDVSSNDAPTCIELDGREYIICNDKLVDVSDGSPDSHLKQPNVLTLHKVEK